MRPIRLATRYAKALFELAAEHHAADEVFEDMKTLSEACNISKDFRKMLQSPLIRFDRKAAIVKTLFGDFFHKITLGYIDVITRKRRENILDEIAEQYIILYRQIKGIKIAQLYTAVEIGEELREKIRMILKEQLSSEVELETYVRPKLIGGFIISVDGRRFDATVLKKINRLTREFNINIYERKL